jgi:glycosidase
MIELLAVLACHHADTDETDVTVDLSNAPIRSCEVIASANVPDGVAKVEVAGTFSDWTPKAMAIDAGRATLSLGDLHPGTYGYKLIFDGTWETVPADVYTTWNDGVENRALVVGDCQTPDLAVTHGEASADGTLDATLQFTRAVDGAGLDPDAVTVTLAGEPASFEADPATGTISVHATGLGPGKHSLRVTARDSSGRSPEHGEAYLPLWVEDTPYTWSSGLLYYVFLDRFEDGGDSGQPPIDGAVYGTDYLGGDLVGARDRLEAGWFDDLGVRSLWLSPVNDNPPDAWVGTGGVMYTGYHGYWPIKARAVDEHLGTTDEQPDEALHALIDEAHRHGIRVMLDVVLNHVHQEHEYVTEHPDWFTAAACPCTTDPGPCNWDTNPIGCWFTTYLPDLDYKNQEIVDQEVSDLLWWAQTFDIDGFRVDAAKHMDHVILRTTSMTLRDRYETPGGAPFYLVGETFTGQGGQGLIMNYVAPYELDGQFDFPLLYPIRNAIGLEQGFPTLANEVRSDDAAYGSFVHGMSPFFGNHDVTRYSTYITGCDTPNLFLPDTCPDRLDLGADDAISGDEWDLINKLSTSFLFVATQPGVPLLYYGDEIGLAGESDPDNRRPMVWDDLSMSQRTLLERIQKIGQVRRDLTALQTGDRRELWVDQDLYVYSRSNGPGDSAIVAMRLGGATRTQTIPIPTALSLEGLALSDALGGTRTATVSDGAMTLTLDPWEYVVLAP